MAAVVAAMLMSIGCAKKHEISLSTAASSDHDPNGRDALYLLGQPYLVNGEPFSGILLGRDGTRLLFRARMRDGHIHGLEEWFHDNGRLQRRERVERDALGIERHIGNTETWCANGKRHSLIEYGKQGMRQLQTTWSCETGKPIAESRFDDTGRIDGRQRKWTAKGILLEQASWRDGVPHGDTDRWTPEGALVEHLHYREGKLQGLQFAWYPDGSLASRGEYADGVPVGRHEAWAEDGQLLVAGNYTADGTRTGPWLGSWGEGGGAGK